MKGKGLIGAFVVGMSLVVGGVASAGFIQGTHVKTDMPSPFLLRRHRMVVRCIFVISQGTV